MFKTINFISVLVLALSAPLAQAAKPATKAKPATESSAPKDGIAGIGKGDSEFGIFGNVTLLDSSDTKLILVGVSLGKFLRDNFELRVVPTIIYLDGGGISSFTFAPTVSGEFLFRGASRSNPVVPFVGAGIGIRLGFTDYGAGSSTDLGLSIGPTGGLKYFISERTSLELALSYLLGLGTTCDVDCLDTTTNTLQQTLRFNFYY